MRNSRSLSRLLCAPLVVLIALTVGCSPAAKKARYLKKADQYFAAGDYEKAEIEYKNVIQLGGLDPQAVARLGIIYLDQGRGVRSAAFLLRAAETSPNNLEVKLKLAHLHLGSGKAAEAQEAASFVLAQRPQDPEAPILLADSIGQPREIPEMRARLRAATQSAGVIAALGILEIKERKVNEAEATLQRALEMDPKSPFIHSALGRIFWSRNDLERADKEFLAAVELSHARSPFRMQYARFKTVTGGTEAAKQFLDETIRKTPDFLSAYLMRAAIATSEKKHQESLALLEKVLLRDPEHPEAMLASAQERLALGDREKAIATLERAASLFPSAGPVHQQLGVAYNLNGDLANAAASFVQAVRLQPGQAGPVIALAQVNIRQGSFTPAVNALKPLAQANPPNNEARLLLAEAYVRQSSFDEALGLYRQLIEASPGNPQLHLLVGSTLLKQGKRAEARRAFANVLELAPGSVAALENLTNFDLAEKQYAAAKARLQTFIEKNPKDGASRVMLAQVHLAQNEREPAEAALRQAIELRPDITTPYVMLAHLYISTNQAPKALENLKAAVSRNPKDASSLLLMGVLQENQKDYAGARDSYEKVLAINPKSAETLNNLAYLLSERTPDLDKALEVAQRARDLQPNQPATADTLGWILYKKRQYARALALLEESAEKLPKVPEALYHAGMAHYMMGNEDKARGHFTTALELSKDFDGAEEVRNSLAVLSIDAADKSDATRVKLEQRLAKQPDDAIALARLAALNERQGNADKAIAGYEAILKANPNNVSATLGLIRMYRVRNEPAKALELAKNARKLSPTDGKLGHALGRLAFETGDHTLAVGVLQEASRRLEGDPEVLFDLAEAAYSIGQVSTAETAWQESLQRAPDFSRAAQARQYLGLIASLEDPSKTAAAAGAAEAALKTDAHHPAALMVKGTLAQTKGDAKAARESFEKVLSRYPNFNPARRNLALIYAASRQDNKRGLELANKAREAYPTDAELAKALGILLYQDGNHTRAVNVLQESARAREKDPEIMYYLGMAQRQLKNASSKKSLEKALELGLSGELAAEARRALTPSS